MSCLLVQQGSCWSSSQQSFFSATALSNLSLTSVYMQSSSSYCRLWLKLMSFLNVPPFEVCYERAILSDAVVRLRCDNARCALLKTNFQVSKGSDRLNWLKCLFNGATAFACRPLVHVCRMVERRAHRKEFRRKGLCGTLCVDL